MSENCFIKSTTSSILPAESLSGAEKASILFSELGASAEKLIPFFTFSEIRKLNRAYKKLSAYNVYDDLKVLEEACNYGKLHGIYKPVAIDYRERLKAKKEGTFSSLMKKDFNSVVSVLRSWLGEEK